MTCDVAISIVTHEIERSKKLQAEYEAAGQYVKAGYPAERAMAFTSCLRLLEEIKATVEREESRR